MTRIDYHFADGTFVRIRLSRLPKAIAKELVKHEQKEAYQRKRDCAFHHGVGYQEGESEIAIEEINQAAPVENLVEATLQEAAVRQALSQLNPAQQRRLRLYAEGHTHAEIARLEGVSDMAVHKSIKLGKKKMKTLLEKGFGFGSDF